MSSTDIITSRINCTGGLPAFLAVPAVQGRVPAIVLMHERYGFVKHTQDLAERFAREGYVCIAPDFFFKHPDQEILHAGDSRYDLSDAESVEYISAAIKALEGVPQADVARIAVKGVCQTGRHPIVVASELKISAALVWYGAASQREWGTHQYQPRPLEDIIAEISCPVLGIFGEADHIISVEDVRRFRDALERHGKSYTIRIYRDAPHGWLNDTMPGRYRREQAESGWLMQLQFLQEVLAPEYDRTRRIQRYDSDVSASYDFSKNVRLA
jgi:carboxymethylenebutenolidase